MSYAKLSLAALSLLAAGFSPAMASTVTGDLAVYKGNTQIGYVSDIYDGQNTFTYTANVNNALDVSVNSSATSPFAITVLNPPGTNTYFGAVGGSGGYNLSPTSADYTYLSDTGLTAAGAQPQYTSDDIQTLGYNAPAESTLWSFNGNVLNAQWVDQGGTVVSNVTVFYDPSVNYLGLTDNLQLYNAAYGDNAYAVTLDFTGTLPTGTVPSATPEPGSFSLLATGCAALCYKVRRRFRRS